ncbi:MAG: AAA family ATPase, partial [Myxococcales bacterium]|nr:AAA family ATPase [Myxococcales bacterium]
MRIEELILRGVGPFEEARFVFPAGRDPDLADVHLLVGPNGSGKTTALRAIAQFLSVMDVGLAGRTWGDSPLYLRTDAGWNALTDNASRTSLDDPDGEPLWNGFPTVAFPGKAPFRHWGQWAESHVRDGRQIAFFGYASDRPMFGTPEAQGAEWSTTDTADLVTWIQNQITKAALAQARQDAGAAERHLLPVRTVEQALSRLWGRLLRFELREEPLTLMMRVDGAAVPTDHLPSGLQTTLAWLGDLMMWLDRGETPPGQSPLHQPVVLLLDEITVHLHPAWQRQILPLVQRLLPKAQIFLATHSPFVVASA